MPPPLVTEPDLFAPRPVPEAERELGPYRLLHQLGSGGMATLFLALDEVGCLVAVKRLHAHLAAERRFVDMFVDEAAIAERIVHPNVCRVHRLEQHAGQLFIVMDYIHGESLSALVDRLAENKQTLPVEVGVHLVGQACLGLHAAHELRGAAGDPLHVVHRDISPQNLLVSYDGELRIVDFGIAAAAAKIHRTETGAVKGKLAYMAPEQARAEHVDRRADIFSLGVVLYEAVCGVRCFAGENAADTLSRLLEGKFVPPRDHCPDLPTSVERVICRALAPNREQRYATAAEMYAELYGFLVSAPGGMTTRVIGDLLRRVFARRYALREEMTALAFGAPDILEEEELTLDLAPARREVRCEFCGAEVTDEATLQSHLKGCAQHAWWEHNFGGPRGVEGAGDAVVLRQRYSQAGSATTTEGLWQRIRRRLRPEKREPLVVRLEGIQSRLAVVRDPQGARLADQAMTTLWGMVAEICDKSAATSDLLGRIKPSLLRCADVLLGVTLEIEANAAHLAATSDRELREQIDALLARAERTTSPAVAREVERGVRNKRALLVERARVAQLREVLVLRLESIVDAIGLTQAKVLQIASSPAMAEMQADTQITVFLDSLLLEVEELGASIREANEALSSPVRSRSR
jgi:tRNA A-37 threonylcarbamoyl transferase component Bud32